MERVVVGIPFYERSGSLYLELGVCWSLSILVVGLSFMVRLYDVVIERRVAAERSTVVTRFFVACDREGAISESMSCPAGKSSPDVWQVAV